MDLPKDLELKLEEWIENALENAGDFHTNDAVMPESSVKTIVKKVLIYMTEGVTLDTIHFNCHGDIAKDKVLITQREDIINGQRYRLIACPKCGATKLYCAELEA